jgi:hypothetical protein
MHFRLPVSTTGPLVRLTVSIVHYDTALPVLAATLSALRLSAERALERGAASRVDVALIVNGHPLPEATLRDALSGTRPELTGRLIQGHGNVGYGRGNNLAIGAASDAHLVLNPDAQLHPDGLCLGLDHLAAEPGCVLVAAAGTGADGTPAPLIKRHPDRLTLILRASPAVLRERFAARLAAYDYADLPGDQPTRGIDIAVGAFMLCRSTALRAVGGFDPRYFLYFEDFDLSRRLARIGRIDYLPALRVTHLGGHAVHKGWRHRWWLVRSAFRYFSS